MGSSVVEARQSSSGEKTAKGYKREWLADLWARYLPPSRDSGGTSVTPSHPSATGSESVTDEDPFLTDNPPFVTDGQPSSHAQRDAVTDVTDKSDARVTTRAGVAYTHCQICNADLLNAAQRHRGFCSRCFLNALPPELDSNDGAGSA
jgi:hypothetical protein